MGAIQLGAPLSPFRRKWLRYEAKVAPYAYIAPFFILFAIFGVFTIGFTFWVSLHDWHIFGDREFIGLANYSNLMSDPRFWRSVTNTFSMLLMATIPQMAMAMVLAELLNDRLLRGPHLFRSGLLIPNITSVVAITIVFQSIFARHFGVVNFLLQTVGVEPVNWHATRLGSHFAIATMVNWQWTGFNTLIFLAALQTIPKDFYEAAEVDGANRAQRFFKISVPLLRPALIFASIVSVIGNLQLFAQPLLFTPGPDSMGGNDQQFLTVLLYLYNQAFSRFRFGYASAIAWTLVLITAATVLIVFGLLMLFKRREDKIARIVRKEVAA